MKKLGEVIVVTPDNAAQFATVLCAKTIGQIIAGKPSNDLTLLHCSGSLAYITYAKITPKAVSK